MLSRVVRASWREDALGVGELGDVVVVGRGCEEGERRRCVRARQGGKDGDAKRYQWLNECCWVSGVGLGCEMDG